MYFFRALQHFNKLVDIGDSPIVTTTYPDDKEILITASKRLPRTEVARFYYFRSRFSDHADETNIAGWKKEPSK